MMKYLLVALASFAAYGSEIRSIKVGGDKEAQIVFTGGGAAEATRFSDNTIELTFSDSKMAEALQGKLDVESPHALIRRISLFDNGSKAVKAVIVVNGTTEGLKSRLSLKPSPEGLKAVLVYPNTESAALNLLKEEQEPITLSEPKKESPKFPKTQLFISLLTIMAAGIATFVFMRFLKNKGQWRGSRKHLIEQLGYCPLGAKAGVSLVKVGKEFVLVGVTPNQVTLLSTLPQLERQYEEESHLERGSFKEAVEEDLRSQSSYNV
jgi:flagellar biogenesis protein FliO